MSDKGKKADWLFFGLVIWALGFSLFGGKFLSRLSLLGNLFASQMIYLAPVLVYLAVGRMDIKDLIPHEKIRLSTVGMTVLFVFLLEPLMTCLNAFTMLFSRNYVMDMQMGVGEISLPVQLLVIAAVPALSEEFIYRGVFLGSYRQRGILASVVLSGLAFGCLHLNFNQFAYAFVLGMAFALLLEATGSIYYGMIGHFIFNGWSVLLNAWSDTILELTAGGEGLLDLQESLSRESLVNSLSLYIVIAAVSTTLAAAVYIWMLKHSKREAYLAEHWRAPRDEESGKRFRISPAYGVGVAMCIGFMIFLNMMNG